jgi:hypothetical protein
MLQVMGLTTAIGVLEGEIEAGCPPNEKKRVSWLQILSTQAVQPASFCQLRRNLSEAF